MAEVTQNDVKALYDDASPSRRAMLAQKLSADLEEGELSDSERDLAIAICQQLAEDAEVSVRQSLAQALKDSTEIPHDLAMALASDVIEVGLPVIEFSTLLSDQDLIALVRTGEEDRQLAVTKRASLSPVVSHTVAEETGETVVSSLLKNKGASILEETYDSVLERFQQSPIVQESLVSRPDLPKQVIAKVVHVVADHLKGYLLLQGELSPVLAEQLLLESRTDAQKRLLKNPGSTRDVASLITKLHAAGKLSSELIFRALEIGDRPFFENALAVQVNIPLENAQALIKDQGDKGFAALYKKAGLPKTEYSAINYLVELEYHSKRNRPLTAGNAENRDNQEPESWLTETNKKRSRWNLF